MVILACQLPKAPPVSDLNGIGAESGELANKWIDPSCSMVTGVCPFGIHHRRKVVAEIIRKYYSAITKYWWWTKWQSRVDIQMAAPQIRTWGLNMRMLDCVKLRKSVKVVKWVGSGRGTSRPVQNDQRKYRKVVKQVSAKDSLKKIWKTWF